MQTAGVIRSNRLAVRDWVQESIAADLVVTRQPRRFWRSRSGDGSPTAQSKLKAIPGIEEALPVRLRKQFFRDTQVLLIAYAYDYYHTDMRRPQAIADLELYKVLGAVENGVIISDNFALLHKVKVGDTITLTVRRPLKVVGKLVDYSWNHGTLIVNQNYYEKYWQEHAVWTFLTCIWWRARTYTKGKKKFLSVWERRTASMY